MENVSEKGRQRECERRGMGGGLEVVLVVGEKRDRKQRTDREWEHE